MAHYLRPQATHQDISPLIMPPSEFNFIMPQGTSAQLARAVATRRPLSYTTTPATSQRSSVRITKPKTRGNSPHYVQRRRTTASYPNRELYPVRGQRANTSNRRLHQPINQQGVDCRPFSWHPGSDVSQMEPDLDSADQCCLGTAISGLQNLAMDNSPAPSHVQQSIQYNVNVAYGYGLPTGLHQQPQALTQSRSQYVDLGYPNYATPLHFQTGQDTSKAMPLHHLNYYGGYHQAAPYQEWQTEALSRDSTADYPLQYHLEESAPDAQDDGEELVGIGLYDDKASSLSPTTSACGNQVAPVERGKELKLEESWQPPESQDSDDESSDEAEESASIDPSPEEVRPAVIASHVDLSNQSFFFGDDDDQAMGGQDYTTFLALQSQFGNLGGWKGQSAGLDSLMFV